MSVYDNPSSSSGNYTMDSFSSSQLSGTNVKPCRLYLFANDIIDNKKTLNTMRPSPKTDYIHVVLDFQNRQSLWRDLAVTVAKAVNGIASAEDVHIGQVVYYKRRGSTPYVIHTTVDCLKASVETGHPELSQETAIKLGVLYTAKWSDMPDIDLSQMLAMHGSVEYTCRPGSMELLKELRQLRSEGRLCDVQLIIDDNQVISTHRVVLACVCKYFAACLPLSDNYKTDFFYLYDVDAETVELVLDFIYGSTLKVQLANLHNVYEVACLLQVDAVIHFCEEISEGLNNSEMQLIKLIREKSELKKPLIQTYSRLSHIGPAKKSADPSKDMSAMLNSRMNFSKIQNAVKIINATNESLVCDVPNSQLVSFGEDSDSLFVVKEEAHGTSVTPISLVRNIAPNIAPVLNPDQTNGQKQEHQPTVSLSNEVVVKKEPPDSKVPGLQTNVTIKTEKEDDYDYGQSVAVKSHQNTTHDTDKNGDKQQLLESMCRSNDKVVTAKTYPQTTIVNVVPLQTQIIMASKITPIQVQENKSVKQQKFCNILPKPGQLLNDKSAKGESCNGTPVYVDYRGKYKDHLYDKADKPESSETRGSKVASVVQKLHNSLGNRTETTKESPIECDQTKMHVKKSRKRKNLHCTVQDEEFTFPSSAIDTETPSKRTARLRKAKSVAQCNLEKIMDSESNDGEKESDKS